MPFASFFARPEAAETDDEPVPTRAATPLVQLLRPGDEDGPEGARLPPSTFEDALRPHFAAAHNLGRWLTRSQADAEDVLQEAVLRAFRSWDAVRPRSPRAWLLRIVRNCCYDLRKQHERDPVQSELDVDAVSDGSAEVVGVPADGPEARLLRIADGEALQHALLALVPEFREAFLLREVEGLAYKEIADVLGVPVGTVMSRLSRARAQLRTLLAGARRKESA
jgi:RNA polymerase sigma-70 factor (ECF subfamily)